LRAGLIGLAQRRVLAHANAYPFRVLSGHLPQQVTAAGTTFLHCRRPDRSAIGVELWQHLIASPHTLQRRIVDLYAIHVQRIVLNMQISLTHSIARQALDCAGKVAQAHSACVRRIDRTGAGLGQVSAGPSSCPTSAPTRRIGSTAPMSVTAGACCVAWRMT